MSYDQWQYPNHYICTRLDEILKCYETHNYTMVPALVHQVRVLAAHMEEALEDVDDIKALVAERHRLKKEVAELRILEKELKEKVGAKPDTDES